MSRILGIQFVEIGAEVNPYQHGENLQPISKEREPNLISKIAPENKKDVIWMRAILLGKI